MMYPFLKLSNKTQRGFTLLIAMIFVAVILSVGLTLANVSYKQVILASTARQSEYAFYNADSALECALELDQQYNTFDYTSEPVGTVYPVASCQLSNAESNFYVTASGVVNNTRTSTFSLGCYGSSSGDPETQVTILKKAPGSASPTTIIYSNGFNNCNASDPQRVERGLKAQY